uniref:Uncharacterized protein n=1 Tax=Arion vulgaris TaxID=1028688 RepID=A0A0B7B1Z5_9EUPU
MAKEYPQEGMSSMHRLSQYDSFSLHRNGTLPSESIAGTSRVLQELRSSCNNHRDLR